MGKGVFEECDFAVPSWLTEEQRQAYHVNLAAAPGDDDLTIKVSSEKIGGKWYTVTHDFFEPWQCTCEWATFHKQQCYGKHFARAKLVLYLRSLRVSGKLPGLPSKEEVKMNQAQLNNGGKFSLLRQQD